MKIFRPLLVLAWALLLGLAPARAEPDVADIPKHLAIARDLALHIAPENNEYARGRRYISLPGDLFADRYSMRADCSGFVIAVLNRAGSGTWSRMVLAKPALGRTRPTSEDFVYSITKEKGFRRVMKVEDLRPGDILAHEMLNPADRVETGSTGHTMIVNSVPVGIPAREPIVDGTRQFEVGIIDANDAYLGEDDSRLIDPARKIQGLGTGTLRLYADDQGELVGFSRTFKKPGRFFSYSPRFPSNTKLRIAAMGRPLPAN